MPTPTTTKTPSQLFCIHPGQPQALAVPAGSELFCASGHLLLRSGPQGLMDGTSSLQWQLSTGQCWRAPCLLWLQISAPAGPAHLQCRMGPVPAQASPTVAVWLRGLGWWRPGRGRTAAG